MDIIHVWTCVNDDLVSLTRRQFQFISYLFKPKSCFLVLAHTYVQQHGVESSGLMMPFIHKYHLHTLSLRNVGIFCNKPIYLSMPCELVYCCNTASSQNLFCEAYVWNAVCVLLTQVQFLEMMYMCVIQS